VAFDSSGRWGCSMSAATSHGGGDELQCDGGEDVGVRRMQT